MMLKGTPISRGIARGAAYVLAPQQLQAAFIKEAEVGRELIRFREVLEEAENQLSELNKDVRKTLGPSIAEIFSAQALILKDVEFLQKISHLIEQRRINLEGALSEAIEQVSQAFAKLPDPYFRERAADIRDVSRRLLSILASGKGAEAPEIPEGAILVVHELLPSFAAEIAARTVKALVAECGGKTGHAAILARTQGIPAVSGINKAISRIRTGDMLIVDGTAGLVFANPNRTIVKEYERLERDIQAHRTALKGLVDLPARTRDGVGIRLLANIGKSADIDTAFLLKAEGVGLFRTEFAFLIRESLPTEEEQYEIIKSVAERTHPRSVAVRLLDIGGDKPLAYIPLLQQTNPALGERGIRLMLKHRPVLESQMRAILRVSADHPVSILLPMVVDLEDLRQFQLILDSVKAALRSESWPFNDSIPVGVMIETPAAALMIEDLAREADFFSLGTNDLLQYLLAADRGDPNMERYYQPTHPALWTMIRAIAKTLAAAGRELTICGEIAGDPLFTEILVGLGLRSFSVSPSEILEVKDRIRSISLAEAEESADRIRTMKTAREIEKCLKKKAQADQLLPGLGEPGHKLK